MTTVLRDALLGALCVVGFLALMVVTGVAIVAQIHAFRWWSLASVPLTAFANTVAVFLLLEFTTRPRK